MPIFLRFAQNKKTIPHANVEKIKNMILVDLVGIQHFNFLTSMVLVYSSNYIFMSMFNRKENNSVTI
jgi:hypothetical protein